MAWWSKMKVMNRRDWLRALWAAPAAWLAAEGRIRGKLIRPGEGAPALATREGSIGLEGDAETMSVLGDKRLLGAEMELIGESPAPGRFRVGPFHTKSLVVIKDGRKYVVTYWCDVCSIRSYTPGKCVCCQEETELDLRPFEEAP